MSPTESARSERKARCGRIEHLFFRPWPNRTALSRPARNERGVGGGDQPSASIPSNRCQTFPPLLGGPQCAKRKALTGQPSRGGLGKPLGRGEGELSTDISPL